MFKKEKKIKMSIRIIIKHSLLLLVFVTSSLMISLSFSAFHLTNKINYYFTFVKYLPSVAGDASTSFDCESLISELFASLPLITKEAIGDIIPCGPEFGIGNLGCIMNALGGGCGRKGPGKNGGRDKPKGGGPE